MQIIEKQYSEKSQYTITEGTKAQIQLADLTYYVTSKVYFLMHEYNHYVCFSRKYNL